MTLLAGTMGTMERDDVETWIAGYEAAWRTGGTERLTEIFTPDCSYLPSPWSEPLRGIGELAPFWEGERDGPDEAFAMGTEIIAVDGDTAVVRVEVNYRVGRDWRDLWVIRFAPDGRCVAFEEWPFAPGQPDGH